MITFNLKIKEKIKNAMDSIPGVIIFSILFLGLSLVIYLVHHLTNFKPVV